MRSMKLLVAMAVLAAFVAGPVMAQDSTAPAGDSSMSSDQGMSKTTTGKGSKHKKGSKHHKKGSSSGAASSTTTGK